MAMAAMGGRRAAEDGEGALVVVEVGPHDAGRGGAGDARPDEDAPHRLGEAEARVAVDSVEGNGESAEPEEVLGDDDAPKEAVATEGAGDCANDAEKGLRLLEGFPRGFFDEHDEQHRQRHAHAEENEEAGVVVGEGERRIGEDAAHDGAGADCKEAAHDVGRAEEAAPQVGGDGAGDDVVPGDAAEAVGEEEEGVDADEEEEQGLEVGAEGDEPEGEGEPDEGGAGDETGDDYERLLAGAMEDEAGADELGDDPARALDGPHGADHHLGAVELLDENGKNGDRIEEGKARDEEAHIEGDDGEVPAGVGVLRLGFRRAGCHGAGRTTHR